MCDSIVATRPHTTGDFTLFAKNSDRHLGECQPFVQFPGALHARDSRVACTHISIPQVAETYRVMGHSPWWVWGFEQGVNEHGVAVGNQTVFTKERVEKLPGLIGMDLVRLALERGRDAREALEVIATLVERYGQGGSALGPGETGYHNSFMLADAVQAWVLETSGRRWAARPVERVSLTNHLTLGSDWKIGSRDLESFARSEGYWRSEGRLDVAAAYRHPDVPARFSEGRLRRSRALLERGADGRGGALDRAAFTRILRDHGSHPEGADEAHAVNGANGADAAVDTDGRLVPPIDATTDDERYYTLCMHSEPIGTTTASMVAALPVDRSHAWPVWISFGSPCVGVFLPVYVDGLIPDVLARGGETCDDESAWWAFHALCEVAARDYTGRTPHIRAAWRGFEAELERERLVAEEAARVARAAGDEATEHALLSAFMQRSSAAAIAHAREMVREFSC